MRIFPFLSLLCWISFLAAQPTPALFNRIYGVQGKPKGIVQRPDGFLLMLGDTIEYTPHALKAVLVNPQGNLVWQKDVPIAGFRIEAVEVVASPSRLTGVAVQLTTDSVGVVVLDSAANIVWQTALPGYFAQALAATPDSGFVMLASSDVFGQKNSTVYRLDKEGDTLWIRHFTGVELKDVISTSDGGFALAGLHFRPADSSWFREDTRVLKLNAAGQVEWDKAFGQANRREYGNTLAETATGGLVIGTGNYEGIDGDDWGELLVLNAAGDSIGHAALDSERVPEGILPAPDRGWVIACRENNAWISPPWAVELAVSATRVDSSLHTVWQTGTSGLHTAGSPVIALPDGQFAWAMTWHANYWTMYDPRFKLVTFDLAGNLPVAVAPEQRLSVRLSPNPARGMTTLHLPESFVGQAVAITLCDMTGRTVQASQAKAESFMALNISELTAGLYEVCVTTATGQAARARLRVGE